MGIWAAVKYALNSTLGTSSFLSLDKMIQAHGTQTFTSDGTFTVPDGVHKILITAAAGGQAGNIGRNLGNSSKVYFGGLGGNGGDCILKKTFNVTPRQKISITVGKGGAKAGEIGTATVIGSLVTLAGGNNTNNGSNNGGGTGGKGGVFWSGGGDILLPVPGQDGLLGSGGGIATIGINSGSGNAYGGGGGGSIGNGGNGGVSGVLAENVGMNGTMGGGGGGAHIEGYSATVGKGGDGIVIIEW